jgi:hypothetical protein
MFQGTLFKFIIARSAAKSGQNELKGGVHVVGQTPYRHPRINFFQRARAFQFPLAYGRRTHGAAPLPRPTTTTNGILQDWANQFISHNQNHRYPQAAVEMTEFIRNSMSYHVRFERSRRRMKLLVVAPAPGLHPDDRAVRRLGYCRFVQVICTSRHWLDTADQQQVMLGSTVRVPDLPDAGWIPFDPTNGLFGGTDLIPVGVARHASLAKPAWILGCRATSWAWMSPFRVRKRG